MVRLVTDDHTAIKTLYEPSDPASVLVDIVAIHGLGAHPDDTWTRNISNDDNPQYVNWLCDSTMLPEAIPRARIMRYGYKSQWFGEEEVETGPTLISDVARDLLKELEIERKAAPNRPLIFVAHSFGGLVLIKALRMSHDSPGCWANPFKWTAGIISLGTPFRGREGMAQSDMIRAALKFCPPDKVYGKSLDLAVPGNEYLKETVDLFLKARDANPILLWCFYERVASDQGALFKIPEFHGIVVPQESATIDYSKGINWAPLQRNHYNMNKFGKPSESDFRTVKYAILKIADTLPGGNSISLSEADALIRNEYYSPYKLRIERLSGITLPIDHCYINLAIVERPSRKTDVSEGLSEERPANPFAPLSLLRRLSIETPEERPCVNLLEIFNPRKGRNGKINRPRRVLIRGRAGVGKTTLCKKIVHEFLLGAWNDLFSRVLWLPLRELKTWSSKEYNFTNLFCRVFFAEYTNSYSLAEEMNRALADAHSGRTLFVLDGLDEVSGDWDSTDPRYKFLLRLLNWPDVIITSRPQGDLLLSRARGLDLELETLGFYPNQVKEYVENVFTDQNIANNVRAFLQEQILLRDLMRIPIMLDALCLTWTNGFGKNLTKQTMTAVYEDIGDGLWKNYISRLDKGCDRGALVIDTKVNRLTSFDVQELVQDEIYLLEILAFTGVLDDVIDFDSDHINALSVQFKSIGKKRFVGDTLTQLPFLRISDPAANGYQSYHFIHLTLQEYFAARYFVRQWKARRPLVFLALGSQKNVPTDPVAFLLRHKYEPHYDVVWRFVAGFLDAGEGEESLQFFQTLEKAPRDILGPAHQRLVMHCLSEVSMDMKLREQLEVKLSQWLLFECATQPRSTLACETEFPERAVDIAVANAWGDRQRCKLLELLARRQRILPKDASLITAWLEGGASVEVKHNLCKMIGRTKSNTPDNILKHLIPLLVSEDQCTRNDAIGAFCAQSSLSHETLTAITVQLVERGEVRDSSIRVLCEQSYIPEAALQALLLRLWENNPHVRKFCYCMLSKLSRSLPEAQKFVVLGLSDENRSVREAILDTLSEQSELPVDLRNAALARLADESWSVRMAALHTLMRQFTPPREICETAALWLSSEDPNYIECTLNTLSRLPELPLEILDGMVARLVDDHWRVRLAAVKALGTPSLQRKDIRDSVALRLADEHGEIRSGAIVALSWQSDLPADTRDAVRALLEDEESHVRECAIHFLNQQSYQLNDIRETIIIRLEDESSNVRLAAVELLMKKSDLDTDFLKALVLRLADEDSRVIETATIALSKQSCLHDTIIQAVAARFKDDNIDTRVSALSVMSKQSKLSDPIINAIGVQVTSANAVVRETATLALENRPNLRDQIIKSLVAVLDDSNEYVRHAAVSVLGVQEHLDETILKRIALKLNDDDEVIIFIASGVLSERSDLSTKILDMIARPLKSGEYIMGLEDLDLAEKTLRGHADYYSTLLDCPFVERLYSVLLSSSFYQQWTWYVEGGTSCVNTPDGKREFRIRRMPEFRSAIQRARENCVTTPSLIAVWDNLK